MLRHLLIAAALLAAAAPALSDPDPAAAPAGITPTAMTLKRVITLSRVASGKLPPGTPHTEIESWTYRDGALSGTETTVTSGEDYRTDITEGPFHNAEGALAGKAWEQNRNGYTRIITGIHKRDDANEEARAHALERGSGVTLLGEVAGPVHAYVVKVDPPHGRVEYVFYDAATYLVVRTESAVEGRRIVYTYDDFRDTEKVRRAWHVHRSNGFKDDDKDWTLQSLSYGITVDPAKLAMPAPATALILSGAKVALPARMSGDRIIVRVGMASHKVDLQLDSGASGILLNQAVADATGVKSFGQKTEVTAGQYLAADALVPKMDFGVAVMQNVAARTAPYAELTYDETPVAGLLGYDFIAGCVLHVDYYDGTVEAIAPSSFSPPASAIALPIRLDDGVPIVSVQIGSATASHFIVDTGADRSMIFSAFAQAHPKDVADQGLGQELADSFPFMVDIRGVGGKVHVRQVQVAALGIGSIRLPDWLFDVSQDAPSFEGEDYDGLIGQDVLRNFDVYFDYARAMMYLVPNERYRQRWGS